MFLRRRGLVWLGLAVGLGASLPGTGLSQTTQPQPGKPQTTLVLPPGPLLPDKFGSWQRVGDENETTNVAQSALPGAAVFVEDGAQRYATAHYRMAAGGETVRLDALQFGDVSGAYSAFTWWASRQGRSSVVRPGGEQADLAGQGLLIRSSAVLVMVHDMAEQLPNGGNTVLLHESGTQRQIVQQLSAALPKIAGPRGTVPLLPSLLPSRGLAAGTVRYALGQEGYGAMGGPLPPGVLGFDKAAEAATGEYNVRGAKATLTVLLYPTPQIAGERGRAIEAAVNADRKKYGATLKLRRDGTLVAMAWGEISGTAADALVKSANLHEELSWNDAMAAAPNFNNEVHKTASLLQNIVVLSGVMGAGAILLGLFLGFGRAGIRVMMGKPAASEPEFLSINLRGIPRGALEEQRTQRNGTGGGPSHGHSGGAEGSGQS